MIMKTRLKFTFLLLSVAMLCIQNVFADTQSHKNGRRYCSVLGDVQRMSDSDGTIVEFNKDGNIVLTKLADQEPFIYEYFSKDRFSVHGDCYDVIYKGNQRIEKLDIPDEDLDVTYTFDASNRIISKEQVDYGEHLLIQYLYEDEAEEFLPSKVVNNYSCETGQDIVTSYYTYLEKDEVGNWTKATVREVKEFTEYEVKSTVTEDTLTLQRTLQYYSDSELAIAQVYKEEVSKEEPPSEFLARPDEVSAAPERDPVVTQQVNEAGDEGTFFVVLRIIAAIIVLAAVYYLFKLLLHYVLHMLAGALIGGLSWLVITASLGYFGIVIPKTINFIILGIMVGIPVLWFLYKAILSSKEGLKMSLLSKLPSTIMQINDEVRKENREQGRKEMAECKKEADRVIHDDDDLRRLEDKYNNARNKLG